MAQASLIWLEPASAEFRKTEELLCARVFVNSCSSLGVESKKVNSLQDIELKDETSQKLVLIAGEAGSRKDRFLLDLARKLRESGRKPIFILDALSGLNKRKRKSLLNSLETEHFHTTTQESAIQLLRIPQQLVDLFA